MPYEVTTAPYVGEIVLGVFHVGLRLMHVNCWRCGCMQCQSSKHPYFLGILFIVLFVNFLLM